jgi:hypothetical protein
MILMVFAPCADAAESETDQMEQIVKISSQDITLENGTDQHAEACSPLCSCKCCPSVASDTLDLTELNLTSPTLRTVQIKPDLFTSPPDIIWSPPRLLS